MENYYLWNNFPIVYFLHNEPQHVFQSSEHFREQDYIKYVKNLIYTGPAFFLVEAFRSLTNKDKKYRTVTKFYCLPTFNTSQSMHSTVLANGSPIFNPTKWLIKVLWKIYFGQPSFSVKNNISRKLKITYHLFKIMKFSYL